MQISRILSFSSARVLGHTRFLSSTARESAFPRLELPELPPPALATPFGSVQSLTQADFRQYVRPLCQRNWLVFMERPNLILSDHSLARSEHTVPMLGKKFWFLRGRAAVEFLADVVKIAGQEEHEPRISLFLGRTKQHVLVRTYTLRTLGDTEEFLATNVVPGLSTRDLRLALLFETHFQEEYVGSEKAWPLREMLEWPRVPSLAGIRRWQMSASRVPETPEVDEKWTPLPSDMSPLPSPPDPKDAGTICTDEHFDAFLRPLYMRGWLAAFMPILGKGKLYAPTLCLTRFFTFVNLAAATSFIRDVVAGPWYKEDNAELHFLIDAHTVRAHLVYPPEHDALTLGNLRAALRIERLFRAEYIGSARLSYLHPYGGVHQPRNNEELQATRATPMRSFRVRYNEKQSQE